MQARIAITFDVDWAPDWALAQCIDMCAAAGVAPTVFATHSSQLLHELSREKDTLELGIHPNFQENSSHGGTVREVLSFCRDLVPDARSMRTHGLFQSTNLLETAVAEFDIQNDASVFLPFQCGLHETDVYYGVEQHRMTRVPYFWEDDVAVNWPGWDGEAFLNALDLDQDGLLVFDFHPIHVALNTERMAQYDALKAASGNTPMSDLSSEDLSDFVHPGYGVATFLRELLQAVRGYGTFTIDQLAQQHRKLTP